MSAAQKRDHPHLITASWSPGSRQQSGAAAMPADQGGWPGYGEAPADDTVRFGVGTTEYEIDLNEKNAAKLRARLAPFVEHARRVRRGQPRRAARTGVSRQHSPDVRAWAVGEGLTISERGRIPASVVAQYEAASGGRLPPPPPCAEPADLVHTPNHRTPYRAE
jgi:hypothetical protein